MGGAIPDQVIHIGSSRLPVSADGFTTVSVSTGITKGGDREHRGELRMRATNHSCTVRLADGCHLIFATCSSTPAKVEPIRTALPSLMGPRPVFPAWCGVRACVPVRLCSLRAYCMSACAALACSPLIPSPPTPVGHPPCSCSLSPGKNASPTRFPLFTLECAHRPG